MLPTATLLAGIPANNNTLYHRIRFVVGDPAALIDLHPADGRPAESILIIRDIEAERARRHARTDRVASPADFAPHGGLSGDRETATAQAVAECLRRHHVKTVRSDRTLALSFVEAVRGAGITIVYDADLGVRERRSKDAQEIRWIHEAQEATEAAIAMACGMVAQAKPRRDGGLELDGAILTSERVMTAIDIFLMERGYANPGSIVAGGPVGADCHDHGHGELRTEQPVIVDIFPRSRATRYNGDCTRTVVNGRVSTELARMHAAVVAAKAAAIAAIHPGVTGDSVHRTTVRVIQDHGYHNGFPPEGAPDSWCGIVHGTGHGLGLDVHEPPLLADKGPELVIGDAVTVEPGLYCKAIGGVRVEDLVVVTPTGCTNLNELPEGLDCWA